MYAEVNGDGLVGGVAGLVAVPVPDDYASHEEFVQAQMSDPELGPV